ncbi:Nucleic acid-binding OB-fold [Arabidopsis thaliana x Arabidopsis arenosa]|uniref:Nucleic acid-binding OB-fold n=1 Tax=Arabidopsis thaliana x Arabidopsis arenosa TaxID=1240361 RepID=A0A8T1XD50_9BRAS|nr:Nucleic acid-binding OB-fold [Arabidopsis thaliana x Arabidopsis arenosa]
MEITATIWAEQAEQAEQLEDKYRVVGSDNIVLIMTSVLIKTYQGAICLSASSGTKFYLSREFDPVTTFRKSYDGGCLVNLGSMIEQAPMNIRCSEPLHSINDIWEFISSDVPQKKTFVCKATITDIVLRKGWNYISCSTCSTKLEKSGSSLNCQKCGKTSQSVGVLSFKIEVIVDDGDDSATLVIFDQDGSQITGTTAEDIKRNSGEEELKGIPKSLRTIIGETYLFALSRVTTTAGLQILKVGTKHYDSSVLQNIVYQEVFNNI